MPSRYTPGGRAHKALAAMEHEPANLEALLLACGLRTKGKGRSKLWFTLRALIEAGRVAQDGPLYSLTDPGRALLAELRTRRLLGDLRAVS